MPWIELDGNVQLHYRHFPVQLGVVATQIPKHSSRLPIGLRRPEPHAPQQASQGKSRHCAAGRHPTELLSKHTHHQILVAYSTAASKKRATSPNRSPD